MIQDNEQQPGVQLTDPTRDGDEVETFRIHMVTWNVATADPPDDVTPLLHLNSSKSPDLYVIGLQEVYSGPLRFLSDALYDDTWSHRFLSTLAPRNYIKGNKGGVSLRLSLYGHTLCFLNCHLAAHMSYVTERVEEFEYIMDTQSFNSKKALRIADHRLVFWFGDLNFRIQDHNIHFVRSCVNNQTYNLLWSKDQLNIMKKKEQMLQEFEEGPLNFPPTYKFDVNSNHYDTSTKKRKPAWTDRILWRFQPKAPLPGELHENMVVPDMKRGRQLGQDKEYTLKIRQDLYTSSEEYSISDHKPVIGVFTLELKKMFATPLVHLQAEGEWRADIDATIVYHPLESFPSSTWDWIGLYKVGFSSVSDYITFVWVKDDEVAFNEEVIQVYVGKEEIPVQGGECLLCYYSSVLQCIIGISDSFKVKSKEDLLPETIDVLERTVESEDSQLWYDVDVSLFEPGSRESQGF
ncbi:inositol polyphosphate 5-phosphatase K-like isoform X2 [Antennarius striatus]|uniref:inositol polyphosphate 5-phosphatase K-like isoform X2 n=1 Tax=Antennarius striatus TaxID=241820 RepID=UPI0035B4029A